MAKSKFKLGDKVCWKSYGRLRTGTIKKINPKDEKSLKVIPDDDVMKWAVAIKEKNVWQA